MQDVCIDRNLSLSWKILSDSETLLHSASSSPALHPLLSAADSSSPRTTCMSFTLLKRCICKSLRIVPNIFSPVAEISTKRIFMHSAACSSGNRGGHGGQIPQWCKWKRVGGGGGKGGGDRKGERSKVREGGEEGGRRRRKTVLAASSFWILLLLHYLRDLQFTWTSSDEPNMRVLSYQWMDSLPHSTVSCNPSPFFSPPSLFPHISFDMWLNSLLFQKDTGRSHTAGLCFQQQSVTLNIASLFMSALSLPLSPSLFPVVWVMFSLGDFRGQYSLRLLRISLKFTAESDLQPSSVTVQYWQICSSRLKCLVPVDRMHAEGP